MKLFADTADLNDIETLAAWGVLSGVTTNPTLLNQVEGDEDTIYRKVCELVDGPISAEVVADARETMISEGARLAAIHPNIVVKLPMGAESLVATSALAKQGIRVNMTLVFSAAQAILAASSGAAFVSPFLGRFDDIGHNGLPILAEIVESFDNSDFETEVLAASIRSPVHVVEAARLGADIATIPPKVFYQMLQHPLTSAGIEKFNSDHAARLSRSDQKVGQ